MLNSKGIFNSVKTVLKGYAAAALISCAGVAAAGLLLRFTEMSMELSYYVLLLFVAAAALTAGYAAAAVCGRRGAAAGLLAGAVYIVALAAAFYAAAGMSGTFTIRIPSIAVPLFCAAVGGIAGVGRASE